MRATTLATAFLLLSIALPTYCEPFEFKSKYTPTDIAKFFNGTYSDDIEFTADYVLNRTRENNRHLRLLMMADYIDLGRDLSFLTPYGLEKISDKKYRIDKSKHPGWVQIRDLNWAIHQTVRRPSQRSHLASIGITKDEIAAIEGHVRAFDIFEISNSAGNDFILKNGKKLATEFFSSESDKFAVFEKLRYNLDERAQDAHFNWLSGLLSKLKPAPQQALLSYLYKEMGEVLIFPSENISAGIQHSFQSMADGSMQKAILDERQ